MEYNLTNLLKSKKVRRPGEVPSTTINTSIYKIVPLCKLITAPVCDETGGDWYFDRTDPTLEEWSGKNKYFEWPWLNTNNYEDNLNHRILEVAWTVIVFICLYNFNLHKQVLNTDLFSLLRCYDNEFVKDSTYVKYEDNEDRLVEKTSTGIHYFKNKSGYVQDTADYYILNIILPKYQRELYSTNLAWPNSFSHFKSVPITLTDEGSKVPAKRIPILQDGPDFYPVVELPSLAFDCFPNNAFWAVTEDGLSLSDAYCLPVMRKKEVLVPEKSPYSVSTKSANCDMYTEPYLISYTSNNQWAKDNEDLLGHELSGWTFTKLTDYPEYIHNGLRLAPCGVYIENSPVFYREAGNDYYYYTLFNWVDLIPPSNIQIKDKSFAPNENLKTLYNKLYNTLVPNRVKAAAIDEQIFIDPKNPEVPMQIYTGTENCIPQKYCFRLHLVFKGSKGKAINEVKLITSEYTLTFNVVPPTAFLLLDNPQIYVELKNITIENHANNS